MGCMRIENMYRLFPEEGGRLLYRKFAAEISHPSVRGDKYKMSMGSHRNLVTLFTRPSVRGTVPVWLS